jgi:hypothetical protein
MFMPVCRNSKDNNVIKLVLWHVCVTIYLVYEYHSVSVNENCIFRKLYQLLQNNKQLIHFKSRIPDQSGTENVCIQFIYNKMI